MLQCSVLFCHAFLASTSLASLALLARHAIFPPQRGRKIAREAKRASVREATTSADAGMFHTIVDNILNKQLHSPA